MANQNSTGEMTFDFGSQQTYRFTSEPLDPKPTYDIKILGKQASIEKKEEPGKYPYILVPLEFLNTAKKEGDKNRVLWHRLFTSLKLDKQGKVMVNREDQAVQLGKAAGSMPNVPTVNLPTGETNPETGEALTQRCLNPQILKTWIEGLDGKVVKGKVKTVPPKDGYPAKSEVDMFIAPTLAMSGAGSPDPFADEDKKKGKK